MQDVVLLMDDEPIATVPNVPNNAALISSGQPRIIDNQKGLAVSFLTGDPEAAIVFLWEGPVEVQVGGQLHVADAMVCRAVNPTVRDRLAFLHVTAGGELPEFTILDEAVGMREAQHTGSGSAQMIVGRDADGDGEPDLELNNPVSGALAVMASQRIRHAMTPTRSYHSEFGLSMLVPDPCAGLPPDCISWPDDARYFWSTTVYGDDPFTAESEPPVSVSLSCEWSNDGGTGHVDMFFDPSGLGTTTCLLQMYLDGVLVDEEPDYSGPLEVSGPGGNNLNWPFGNETILGNASLSFTATFVGGRYVLRSGVPLLGKPVLCDEIRFTANPPNLMLTGLGPTTMTTKDIPKVILTGMQFDTSPICRADIAPPGGNGTVGVPDLLAVINSWGPCAAPCAADLAPEPIGNGIVGVPDLLYSINNWGACP
jgi:hypothetical protein